MGFNRQLQPAPPPICIAITDAVEDEIEALLAPHRAARDPFLLAVNCPQSPTGQHQVIFDCGDVVCPHCSTVLP